jgi:peptide/nickel transport system substrate-binding protein
VEKKNQGGALMITRKYPRKKAVLWIAAIVVCLGLASIAQAGPKDNSLVIANTSKLNTLDLYDTSSRDLIILYNEISDPLVDRDPETMKLVPGAAEFWKIIDNVTLEFKLRPGIKFHTGNSLTAEDFRYVIMDRVLPQEMKSPQRTNITWVKEVQVIDELTFRIISNEPYAPGLQRLNSIFSVDSKLIKEKGLPYFAENPSGTGPYKFVKWEKGARLELVRNPDYWRPGIPQIEKLIIRIIPERSTQLAELLKGDIDFIRTVPPDQAPVIEVNPNTKVASTPILRIVFFTFDVMNRSGQGGPILEKKVRQAIWHAIDREAILKNVLLGYGQLINTPLNPMHFGFDKTIENLYPYDPEKAKKLLTEAGYPNGFELDQWMYGYPELNLAVQGYLSKVGIKTKIHDYTENSGQLTDLRRAGRVSGMGNFSWGSYNVFDADAMLYAWFHSSDTNSYAHSPEIDKILDEARTTTDATQREKLYSQVQRWAVENAMVLPSHAMYEIYGVNAKLNYKANGDEVPRYHRASWMQ